MSEQMTNKPSIACVDNWLPGTFTKPVMLAYKALERVGVIRVQRVEYGKRTGKAVVHYTSSMPRDETLALLGRAKREIEQKAVT